MATTGYIYVKDWKKYQHPDVVRGGGRMPWIKDYTDQLNNDKYLDLPLAYRAGLQDIRRLVADVGQGRCSARADLLQKRCSWPAGWAQKILDRLIHDGFIEVRASKAQATRKPKKEKERVSNETPRTRASASTPQAAVVAPVEEEEPPPAVNGWHGAAEAKAKFLQSVKPVDPPTKESHA